MRRLALVSVADKTGVVELAIGLVRLGYEVVSTGGTARALQQAGVPVTPIESVTRLPEMLDGRVKTLHPAVHGGILARRDLPEHMRVLGQAGWAQIDVVAVNLYPFRETVARPDATFEEGVEQIDIGGPAMVRSAAKNHGDVLVVVDPADYAPLLAELQAGPLPPARRRQMAAKAFAHTAAYDAAIAGWLETGQAPAAQGEGLHLDLGAPERLRYGENPHQAAWRYPDAAGTLVDRLDYRVHQGKELSYNNLVDADAAWAMACDLPPDRPGAVVVKHTNPCGVGSVTTSIAGAVLRAFEADPISAFGGILAVNQPFDITAARALGDRFLEVVLAPRFEDEALEVLSAKPNLRVVEMGPLRGDAVHRMVRTTFFGLLAQEPDLGHLTLAGAEVPTRVQPTPDQLRALELAWRVVKHVKSNAIVLGDDTGTVGVGAGQTSRVDSAVIAVGKARRGMKATVAASDAFFPFADGVETLAKAGIKAIVQPGGSKRDAEVVAAADAAGIAMVMTGFRHFRH